MAKFSKLKDRLKCNQPKREKKGEKTHVVKACQDGKEKIVRFGHSMPDGTKNKERRKSYCARSGGIKVVKVNYLQTTGLEKTGSVRCL